jgi:hypothetical protein
MAYQNINQYVYNKWYLKPVQEVSDLSLASDERQYNQEVIFSPYIVANTDGDVMPIKIDTHKVDVEKIIKDTYSKINEKKLFI